MDISVVIPLYNEAESLPELAAWIERVMNEHNFSYEVLMIDDLGSEPLMQNVTVEQLFNLLNERQNRNLATVISTNLDMAKFRERYTERIASRLRDSRCCKVLNLLGRDIRIGGRAKA